LKNLQKHVTTPQKAYVEDVTDEEDADYNHAKQHGTADLLEEGFFFLDEDSDSDEDSEYGEEDIDEEELAELKTEDNIHCFNAILAGAAKFRYCTSPKTDNINEMEENVRACPDNMPILQIKRFGISSHAYQLLIVDFHQICQQIGLFYQRILTGSVRP
jgi:hypothetical protein